MSESVSALTPEQIKFMSRPSTFYDITPDTVEIAAERLQSLLEGKCYTYIYTFDGIDDLEVRTGVSLTGPNAVKVEYENGAVPSRLWVDQTNFLIWVDLARGQAKPPHISFETVRNNRDTVVQITQYDAGIDGNRKVRFTLVVPAESGAR